MMHNPDVTAGIQQPAYVTGEENSTSPLIVCAILRETTDRTVVITLQTVDGTAQSRFNFEVNSYTAVKYHILIGDCMGLYCRSWRLH